MTANGLTWAFRETGLPRGHIDFRQLAAFAEAIQLLAVRVGRSLVQDDGPGRTRAYVEDAVTIHLVGLREGSTILDLEFGEVETLMERPDLEQLKPRMWEVLDGVRNNRVPTWASELVVDATHRLISASQRISPRQVVEGFGNADYLEWRDSHVDASLWTLLGAEQSRLEVTVVGRLEKVDLADYTFRIVDDVGTKIKLRRVIDAEVVAHLVGSRVVASGIATLDRSGAPTEVRDAALSPYEPVIGWEPATGPDLADLIRSRPGPSVGGIDGVTDDDLAAFLDEIR